MRSPHHSPTKPRFDSGVLGPWARSRGAHPKATQLIRRNPSSYTCVFWCSLRPPASGGGPSRVVRSFLSDPGGCRSWRRFALGRPVVDFRLPRMTIWYQQPIHLDHGGNDQAPVPNLRGKPLFKDLKQRHPPKLIKIKTRNSGVVEFDDQPGKK
jgi:hypothetical protein